MQQKWIDSLENRQQKDIVLKTSTNDTGAQCFVLGRDHLPGLGVAVENLLRSEINLGVFFAKIRGEHHVTAESVEARARLSFPCRSAGITRRKSSNLTGNLTQGPILEDNILFFDRNMNT